MLLAGIPVQYQLRQLGNSWLHMIASINKGGYVMDLLMEGSLNKQSLRKPCLHQEQMQHKTLSCSDRTAAGPSLL